MLSSQLKKEETKNKLVASTSTGPIPSELPPLPIAPDGISSDGFPVQHMGVVPPSVHSIVKEEGRTLSPVGAPVPPNIFTRAKMVKTAMTPVQATRINSAIAELVVDQLLPYSFVDSAAFRKLLKTIEPRFQPLTRKCLGNSIIPAWHEAEVTNLKKVLTSLDSVGLTTDSWTSRATESYMTVTVHYINERNVLSAAVLQTEKITVSHTGANIATELDACPEMGFEWKNIRHHN